MTSVWDTYDATTDPTANGWGQRTDIGEGLKPSDSRLTEMAPGEHAFASVRAGGWHKLGKVFEEPMTADQLLVAAHADYPVFLIESAGITRDAAGNATEIITDARHQKVAWRHPITGKVGVFGDASPNYQCVTNREAFVDFGDKLIEAAEPCAATCGVTYEGRQAFMSWKLPREIKVAGIDQMELWLLVIHSHDQSRPLTAALTPLRTVCANTCRYNLRNARSTWTIKKTRNAKLQLLQVRESLKLSYKYSAELEAIANGLVGAKMTTPQFDKIITENFGPQGDPSDWGKRTKGAWDAKRETLMRLWTTADTQAAVRGTAWAALQTVTEYCDWETKATQKGWDSPMAYRFWRSTTGEKTVTQPKNAMLKIVREFAGV